MREIDRFFDSPWFLSMMNEEFIPTIDIYQDKDNVIIDAAIANVDPDKVDITVENDVLTISGETEAKEEVNRENYYRREIRSGAFSRSVILPMRVKGDQAEAHYEKGLLKIVIPKAEEMKPKKIAIKRKPEVMK